MKWIKRIVLTLVVLVLVVLIVVYLSLNTIVRHAVQIGGKYATDQDTTLASADLSLGGSLELSGLEINNPPSYKTPKFMVMKDCKVTVQPGSLLSNEIKVDQIAVDGLEIALEQSGMKNNLADILAIIQAKSGSSGSGQPASPSAPAKTTAQTPPGRSLKITTIKITGTKVHLNAGVAMTLDLPPVQIDDPTNPDGRPMKFADVLSKILVSVGKQVVDNPQLPGVFKDGFKDVNGLLNNASGVLGNQVKDLGGNLQKGLGGFFNKNEKK